MCTPTPCGGTTAWEMCCNGLSQRFGPTIKTPCWQGCVNVPGQYRNAERAVPTWISAIAIRALGQKKALAMFERMIRAAIATFRKSLPERTQGKYLEPLLLSHSSGTSALPSEASNSTQHSQYSRWAPR